MNSLEKAINAVEKGLVGALSEGEFNQIKSDPNFIAALKAADEKMEKPFNVKLVFPILKTDDYYLNGFYLRAVKHPDKITDGELLSLDPKGDPENMRNLQKSLWDIHQQ